MGYFLNPLLKQNLQKKDSAAGTALQEITASGDEYITLEASAKTGSEGNMTQHISASLTAEFLDYVNGLQDQIHYLQQFAPAYITDVATFRNLVSIQDATVIIFDYKPNQDTTGYEMIGYLDANENIEVWLRNGTEYLVLSDFIIVPPISCHSMFAQYSSLVTLLFYNFKTDDVENMQGMFSNCINLTTLDISLFNTSKVTSMRGLFQECNSLQTIDLHSFDTSSVTSMEQMFYSCRSLLHIDLSRFDTRNVVSMRSMFGICLALTSIDLTSFDTRRVTSMSAMFSSCSKVESINVSSFDTANVTDMSSMFSGCGKLETLDVSNFNTTKVTSMLQMFYSCRFSNIDLSNFDTSSVTTMRDMFYSCSKLTSLDLSNFDTSNVTSMQNMFRSCGLLQNLNLAQFDTALVENMSYMFYHCYALTTIISPNFYLNQSLLSSDMFSDITHIVGGNGTTYDANHIDASYAHIDTAGDPGYFTAPTP